MALVSRHHLLLCLIFAAIICVAASAAVSLPRTIASAEQAGKKPLLCPRSDFAASAFDLGFQCPSWIELVSPWEVSGQTIDRVLAYGDRRGYYSILFYSSWCPFSSKMLPMFSALSSMFPEVEHLQVEEASVMPSMFSRHGIHSFPTIILGNGTARISYHGPKDLNFLVHFYTKMTGLYPATYMVTKEASYSEYTKSPKLPADYLRDLIIKEPYIVFGVFFVCLKMIAYFVPIIYARLKVFWASHAWRLVWGFLRGSCQLLERALHIVDFKRLWCKLRLFNKTRNFRKGANNARAWASSLASVSLGESSSMITHSDS